jgi:hypothetical protein
LKPEGLADMKGLKMNKLDQKIEDMIRQYPESDYDALRSSINQLLRVMSRAHVISFLKYADSLKKAA